MNTQLHANLDQDAQDKAAPEGRFKFFKKFPKPSKAAGKKLFWVWIGYQAVKGTLTTAFIWIPLIYAMIKHG